MILPVMDGVRASPSRNVIDIRMILRERV